MNAVLTESHLAYAYHGPRTCDNGDGTDDHRCASCDKPLGRLERLELLGFQVRENRFRRTLPSLSSLISLRAASVDRSSELQGTPSTEYRHRAVSSSPNGGRRLRRMNVWRMAFPSPSKVAVAVDEPSSPSSKVVAVVEPSSPSPKVVVAGPSKPSGRRKKKRGSRAKVASENDDMAFLEAECSRVEEERKMMTMGTSVRKAVGPYMVDVGSGVSFQTPLISSSVRDMYHMLLTTCTLSSGTSFSDAEIIIQVDDVIRGWGQLELHPSVMAMLAFRCHAARAVRAGGAFLGLSTTLSSKDRAKCISSIEDLISTLIPIAHGLEDWEHSSFLLWVGVSMIARWWKNQPLVTISTPEGFKRNNVPIVIAALHNLAQEHMLVSTMGNGIARRMVAMLEFAHIVLIESARILSDMSFFRRSMHTMVPPPRDHVLWRIVWNHTEGFASVAPIRRFTFQRVFRPSHAAMETLREIAWDRWKPSDGLARGEARMFMHKRRLTVAEAHASLWGFCRSLRASFPLGVFEEQDMKRSNLAATWVLWLVDAEMPTGEVAYSREIRKYRLRSSDGSEMNKLRDKADFFTRVSLDVVEYAATHVSDQVGGIDIRLRWRGAMIKVDTSFVSQGTKMEETFESFCAACKLRAKCAHLDDID